MKKRGFLSLTAVFIILAAILAIGSSCAKKELPDLEVGEISAKFDELIANADKLSATDFSYVENMFDISSDLLTESVVKMQTSGTEIDQYGIFKAVDEDAAQTVKADVQAYVDSLRENWEAFNYLPEEMVKIKSAEVYSTGRYVYYTILSADETAAVTDAFNSLIG